MPHNESQSVSRMKENFTSGLTGRDWKSVYGLVNKSLRNRKGGATGYQTYEIRRQSFTLLPLLAEIVMNTLQTLRELEAQTSLAKSELDGINDRISRIKTISNLVQPEKWAEWRNPAEALKRLEKIYFTLPPEYRSEKSDAVQRELSTAMNELGILSSEVKDAFHSGKELEARGADSSPGVAQKLTASGVGTLVSMSAQQQVLTSHITSLLVQMLAQSQEQEAKAMVSAGSALSSFADSLSQQKGSFSRGATSLKANR